jgi:hypothetical protein
MSGQNNLLGLRSPADGSYYNFDIWEESVKTYRDYVQHKYRNGDYYILLNRMVMQKIEHIRSN